MAKAPNPFAKVTTPKKPALKAPAMKNLMPNASAGQTPMAMNSLKKGGMVVKPKADKKTTKKGKK